MRYGYPSCHNTGTSLTHDKWAYVALRLHTILEICTGEIHALLGIAWPPSEQAYCGSVNCTSTLMTTCSRYGSSNPVTYTQPVLSIIVGYI